MTAILNQLVGGRSQILLLTNKSGGQIVVGNAVVISTGTDASFTTSTSQGNNSVLGAALATIENNETGPIATAGQVNVYIKGAGTRGNFVRHSTTAKQLEDAGSSAVAGVCGVLLQSGTDQILQVLLFPMLGMFGAVPSANVNKGVFGITIDGGGSAITTGVKGYVRVPWAGTITKVTLIADQSGSIVIDVWKDTYANYPPTVADTITASAKPTLATAIKSEDSTLTGWTTSIAAGDIFGFNVDSITTCTRVALEIEYTKS